VFHRIVSCGPLASSVEHCGPLMEAIRQAQAVAAKASAEVERTLDRAIPEEAVDKSGWRDIIEKGEKADKEPDDPLADLNPTQKVCHLLFENKCMDCLINTLVCTGVVIMIIEADNKAVCVGLESDAPCKSSWIEILNTVFLAIYTIEAASKIYIHRRSFFSNTFHCLDLFVVTTGCITYIADNMSTEGVELPNLAMLRMFRILRLSRNLRILRIFPELQKFVNGFIGAMSAMAWGLLLIMCLLVFFAIITVEVVHPVNIMHMEMHPEQIDPWCEVAFASVFNATLLFFQTLVAGDSWGTCVIPLIRIQPSIVFIFAVALSTINLGFMNLILSVVVDSAAQSRNAEEQALEAALYNAQVEAINEVGIILNQCDDDGSGAVSYDELVNTRKTSSTVEAMFDKLTIEVDDMQDMFNLMDADGSGSLTSAEFVKCIRNAQTKDMKVMIMLLGLQCGKIASRLEKHSDKIHKMDQAQAVHFEGIKRDSDSASQTQRSTSKQPPCKPDGRPKATCICGNVFVDDSFFCHKCGAKCPQDLSKAKEYDVSFLAQPAGLDWQVSPSQDKDIASSLPGASLSQKVCVPIYVPLGLESLVHNIVQQGTASTSSLKAGEATKEPRGFQEPANGQSANNKGAFEVKQVMPNPRMAGQADILRPNAVDERTLASRDFYCATMLCRGPTMCAATQDTRAPG